MGSQRVRQDSFCVETQDQTEASGVKTLQEGQIEKVPRAGSGQTHPSPTHHLPPSESQCPLLLPHKNMITLGNLKEHATG